MSDTPTAIYVQWSDDGQHIRKWSHEPFDGGIAFVAAALTQTKDTTDTPISSITGDE